MHGCIIALIGEIWTHGTSLTPPHFIDVPVQNKKIELPYICVWSINFAQLLPEKLLKQGYVAPRLKTLLQKLYGRHHNMIDRYKIFISQMTIDLLLFT
jgi:hypothetical protein